LANITSDEKERFHVRKLRVALIMYELITSAGG